MITIGVQNIRRFLKLSEFQIKPITVLVGRNSSGKSTLLRLIPLLKQSLSMRIGAPLLWYGDFVDFGSYESVVSNHDTSSYITFCFKIDNLSIDRREITNRRYRPSSSDNLNVGRFEATYTIGNRDRGSKSTTYLDAINIKFPNFDLDLKVNFSQDGSNQSMILNDRDVSKLVDLTRLRFSRRMLSQIILSVQNQKGDESLYGNILETVWVKLYETIRPYVDRRVSNQSTMVFARRLLDAVPLTQDSILAAANSSGLVAIDKFARSYLLGEAELFKTVKSLTDVLFISRASESALVYLSEAFINSLYIGPARSRSDRYYRYQELAVSDIAPDGSNLPMFLNSLTSSQLAEFSRFVSDSFGFGVTLESSGGHISIYLNFSYDRTNIVDSGFGVSQLLPILAQLWWATSQHRRTRTRQFEFDKTPIIVAIEQPELHLHPAHQARLADVFVQTRNNVAGATPLHLVIETHSSEIINRLGALVEDGSIAASDVQIVLVDEVTSQEGVSQGVQTRGVEFSKHGILQNWPSDFFVPQFA